MKSTELQKAALVAEVVGGLAVLVTLIFLVYQTSESVRATRAETAQGVFDQLQAANLSIGMNVRNETIWLEFNDNGFENLETIERGAALAMQTRVMYVYDNAYYQYRQGTLDDEIFSRFLGSVERRVARQWFPEYWELRRNSFTPSFRQLVEDMMID